MEKMYIDAHNWYLENQQKLDLYRGEWIAFTSNGVIAHDREYLNTIAQIEPGEMILCWLEFMNMTVGSHQVCSIDSMSIE
jgi:hypothetical protein